MKLQALFQDYMEENKESLKMAFSHGAFEEACKVLFQYGYERGWEEGMNDGLSMSQEDEE
jgi:hypothetical protein